LNPNFPERDLHFSNLELGYPVVAFCGVCKARFEEMPKSAERTDDVLLRIRANFEAHHCKGK
jgi:hypothetical protein